MLIGFAGAGNIAAAMARGWAGGEDPPDLAFTDGGSGRARRLADEVDGQAVAGNRELAERADLVVLAVKPDQLDAVAGEIAGTGKPVISLLGATSLERLRQALREGPLIRVMPNIAVEVRRGVLCWSAKGPGSVVNEVTSLLARLGVTIELEDRLMDAATAVMGCSPAYLALAAESLIAAAVREGIVAEQARQMVVETLAGTGEVLRGHHPAEVREAVASPGGSTEAGLAVLEKEGFGATLHGAVDATLEKMSG